VKSLLPESLRLDFPPLQKQQEGKYPIYFDNACTTLVPQTVFDSLTQYYAEFPACGGGRSRYWFAEEVNDRIEGNIKKAKTGSREIIRRFINAESANEIIFTMNTTHAINMAALGFQFKHNDIVLLTDREHNSNLLPWLRLQKLGMIRVMTIKTGENGDFDLSVYEDILKNNRIRLVSMAYTSNLTGFTIPAKEIIRLAHANGARVLLDAAQAARTEF
jgi:cysteine desulfurase/selenocysteine lyase